MQPFLNFFLKFLGAFFYYLKEVCPGLVFGLLLSGLIHELIPSLWIRKKLGGKGLKSIFYATFVGMILPICSWGTVPIAISFYQKGASLGPVLSFLVVSPMTSVFSVIMLYSILGLKFSVFNSLAIMIIGLVVGLVGNLVKFQFKLKPEEEASAHSGLMAFSPKPRKLKEKVSTALKFGFVDMLKEIGPQTLLGIIIAAAIQTTSPLTLFVRQSLAGIFGYFFSLIFGLIMSITSITGVFFVDSFMKIGLSPGAGMVLLLAAPITNYSLILVLRKEFGNKLLLVYLALVAGLSLLSGYVFSLLPK